VFHWAVRAWEESSGLLGDKAPLSSIGSPKAWRSWVETKIPYKEYEHKISLLFQQFAVNELSQQSDENSVDLRITRVSGGESPTGEEVHVELLDGKTHKIGIRAAFTFDQIARALMGEFGIKGRVVRWTLTEKKKETT
jgi:hypothetical protein